MFLLYQLKNNLNKIFKENVMGKKIVKILVGVVLAIVLLVGAIFYFLGSQAREPFVEFGEDKIPTIYSSVGERSVKKYATKIENGRSTKTYTYKKGEVSLEDLDNYVKDLQAENFVITRALGQGNRIQLGLESKDEGELLLVDITILEDGLVAEYMKAKGRLTRYGNAK